MSTTRSAGGRRNLGIALIVIATARLMVVLDATIVNVAWTASRDGRRR